MAGRASRPHHRRAWQRRYPGRGHRCPPGLGADILTAVRLGKAYVTACLEEGLEIGQGQGPVGHVQATPV